MLLSSVIIVLREVLEAAILISILLVLSARLGCSRKWLWSALLAGVSGAMLYSFSVAAVSDWFDGVGQEVVTAGMQISLFAILAGILFVVAASDHKACRLSGILVMLMAVTVCLAVVREGYELSIYLYSFFADSERLAGVIVGSVIGAGIGLSVGVLLYYFLLGLGRTPSLMTASLLLVLIAAAMLSQATQLLIQADWLAAELPIWDSSFLLPESSLMGELLYVLVGYEATPTLLQAEVHVGGIVFLLILMAIGKRLRTGAVP